MARVIVGMCDFDHVVSICGEAKCADGKKYRTGFSFLARGTPEQLSASLRLAADMLEKRLKEFEDEESEAG